MSVLIASVHVPHRLSDRWAALQAQFVAETEGDYEYGVVVNGGDPSKFKNVVHVMPGRTGHLPAINAIMDVFRRHVHRFTHFLLLDSDCWPIRSDWQKVLNKLLGDGHSYAAPMRSENFDAFPHPSAFYMKREFLTRADFNFSRQPNLLGVPTSDVGMAMPRQGWHPLMKTNYVSPHPVYASVYGDLFYHHCAGSRGIGFRAAGSYEHVMTRPEHRKIYDMITTKLLANPRRFIDGLRGVNSRVSGEMG